MNRIFRLVWNRALRLLQVSSELSRTPRGRATGASTGTMRRNGLALACRLALGVVAMSALWAAPPLAAQSVGHATGGNGDSAAGGGAGGDAGQPGANGSSGQGGTAGSSPGGDGGDGSGTGGGGGAAHGGVLTGDLATDMTGGDGGNADIFGGGEGGGGAGGDAALIGQSVDLSIGSGAWLRGGAGGRTSYDGGGGGGGAGLYVSGADVTAKLRVDGAIAGGAGGDSSVAGGGGGAGVVVADGATLQLDLAGRIVGGSGGSAFNSGASGDGIVASADTSVNVVLAEGAEIAGGAGVGAGDGGAGLRLSGGGTIVNNGGSIAGGDTDGWSTGGLGDELAGGSGSGGAAGGTGGPQRGRAGAGIVGRNLSVINAGTISGGVDPNNGRADAITFTGGGNTLWLQSGSVIEGVVDATAGISDLLLMSAAAGGTFDFDVGQIGPTAQYRGFEQYWAVGSGTVALTGTTTELTPWTSDSDAVLSIASDASLGNPGGDLLLRYGGTLQVTGTASETTARNIGIYQNGTIDIADAGNHFSLTGAVTDYDPGVGGVDPPHSMLVKRGDGTLTLAGDNTYSGGTLVEGGTLEIAAGSTAGSLEGHDGMPGGIVQLAGGTTLRNAGGVRTIQAASSQNLPPETMLLPVTITNTGSVAGDELGGGIALFNGKVDNSGSISVANPASPFGGGIMLVGEGSIDNTGSISAPQGSALLLGTPLSTSMPITGAITLDNRQGGSIQGSVGVFANQMVVLVSDPPPTYSSRPITIDNDGGSISGSVIGIELLGGGTVVNRAGSLIETTGAATGPCGVFLPGMGAATSACAIFAPDVADIDDPSVDFVLTPSFLTNAGRIVGNVQLSDELANEVTLVAGGSIDGDLDIGHSGDARLTLQGDAGTRQTYSQAVTGTTTFAGQLVKSGDGTWVLDDPALADVTGTTQVQAGSLIVGGTAGDGGALGGNVAVAGGATLGGHGTIAGDVAVAQGGVLSPGHSIGQLTIGGDLDLAAGSVLDVELGTPLPDFQAFGAGDRIAVGGDLSIDGATLDVSDAGSMGPGLYNVLNWGGTLSLSGGGLTLGATPAGSSFVIQTLLGEKQINLLQTGGLVLNVWNANGLADATRMGGGDGTWSAVSAMWTDASGVAPNGAMAPQPGFALFGGDAGTVAVDNGAGAVGATGMQFAVDGYTLTGDSLTLVQDADGDAPIIRVGDGTAGSASTTATIDAVLAGTDGLVKDDYGTLVLTGANTYDGGTTIAAGTLQVGDGGTAGSIAGDVANRGALVFDRSDDVGFDGDISGTGSLTQRGGGTLTLTGANTYGGGTTIAAGTLRIGDGGTRGSIAGDVANNGTLVFDRSDDVAFGGVISGGGSLVQQGGTLALDGDSGAFAGSTQVRSGGLVVGTAAGNGAALGGDVAVDGGATLAGHGSIGGDVEVRSGGHLSPGSAAAAIGTLGIGGDLVLAAGSELDIGLGTPLPDFQPFGAGDNIAVGGDLTLGGATLNVGDAGGMGPGLYNVLTWGGTLTESGGGIALGAVPAGSNLIVQTLSAQKQVNLIENGGLVLDVWNANGKADATRMGGGDGTWSTVSQTWTDASGTAPNAAMQPQPGFALFGGDAGTVTVDNNAGAVSATGMQFAVDGYRLAGDTLTLVQDADGDAPIVRVGDGRAASASMKATVDAVLAGTDGLVKADYGTLVLTGDSTYGGGTTIAAGTLQLGDGGSSGSIVGDVANRGTLVFDRSDDVDFDGAVSGTGSLVQQGHGTLTLTGANTYGGGTTIAAGGLRIGDGGTAGSIVGDVANDGALVFDRSDDVDFGGDVSGAGSLTQQGKGMLTLTGAGSWTGGTTIAAGSLRIGDGGTAGSIVGDVANGGTLVFDRSDDVSFGGAVSGAGALVQDGSGSLTLTGANTYTGGTTIAAGTLVGDTRSLHGAIANHGALVFAQAGDGRFDGRLSGSGSLAKTGQGELVLNGDNRAFTGDTRVGEGALIVGDDGFADASLGGTVTVGKHGLLGGFGTVGGLDLAGTLATGHSIGTLDVAGDAVFRAGSAWRIDVDPDGHGDRLDVAGKASIEGGSALAIGADGRWQAQTDYVVLDAAGGVDGEFDGISSNLAFLTPTLSYAANSVTLSLVRNQVDLGEVAHTPNQAGVAHGIEDLGPGHPVHDAIVGMDAGQARGAFDQLSGEWYAGMQSARLDDSRYVREAMDLRLNQADSGTASANAASLGRTAGTIWFHGWGQWGDRDGDGNAARMQASGSGMLVGVDADLDGRARIGGVLGASQSSIRVGERVSDGRDKATWVGIYASAATGPVQWRAGLAHASERLESHRHLTVRDLAGSVGANLHGRTEQGWIEAALPHATARGWIDPFLNLAHVRVHSDGWSEGGGATALQGGDNSARASLATLGVRGAWNLGSAELPIRLHGSLGWRQAFGTDTPEMRMSLDGSAPFTVYGLPLVRHAIAVQAGLDFAVSGRVSVDLGYSGQFAGDARDQGARVTVRIGL